MGAMEERFTTSDVSSRAAVLVARSVGFASRAWGQKGLGTMYQALGRLPVVGGARCTARIAPDTRFATPVFDPYWGPTILGGRPFEPELGYLLRRLAGAGATFLDCGANFGYWSVIASGPEFDFRHTVAIEPNPSTFARLVENARLNGDRFRCVQRAVCNRTGDTVRLTWSDQHAVSYVDERGQAAGVDVQTITLDDLVTELGWDHDPCFVLKIDVEGQEEKTIEGAARLRREHEHLMIVEDFPTKRDLWVVQAVPPLGYELFYVSRRGTCHRVRTSEDVHRLAALDGKSARSCNFVATRPAGAMHDRMAAWARD